MGVVCFNVTIVNQYAQPVTTNVQVNRWYAYTGITRTPETAYMSPSRQPGEVAWRTTSCVGTVACRCSIITP